MISSTAVCDEQRHDLSLLENKTEKIKTLETLHKPGIIWNLRYNVSGTFLTDLLHVHLAKGPQKVESQDLPGFSFFVGVRDKISSM